MYPGKQQPVTAVNRDYWDLQGAGSPHRTDLAPSCNTNFPKHWRQCSRLCIRPHPLIRIEGMWLATPDFYLALPTALYNKNRGQHYVGPSKPAVTLMSAHLQSSRVKFIIPFGLRSHLGAFSLGQHDQGLSPVLAIFWKKHPLLHHWVLLPVLGGHEHGAHMTPQGISSNSPTHIHQLQNHRRC